MSGERDKRNMFVKVIQIRRIGHKYERGVGRGREGNSTTLRDTKQEEGRLKICVRVSPEGETCIYI